MSRDCYCVIDFETTGLSPAQAEVVEFAAVRVHHGEIGLKLASLCQPHGYISRQATAIHGITNEMVADFPPFEHFLPILLDFIGEDTVVAHNIPFDMGFLSHYCRRCGYDFFPPTLCTLQLSRRKLRLPSNALGNVAARFQIPNPAAHRALGDAETTAQVLLKLLELE